MDVKGVVNGLLAKAPKDGFSAVVDECETPLKIAIVGAGIGGLSAAIGLRKNGHEVQVRTPYSHACVRSS